MIEYDSGQMYICQTGKESYPIGGVKEMTFDGAPYMYYLYFSKNAEAEIDRSARYVPQ